MFCKLAFQNVRKSLRDYAVYFMTLTLGVCIFYVFNSVESQQAMLDLNASQSETMLVIVQLINMTSVFVSFILAFLILYANKFMIRRRKKELGIYMTLGMPKGKISAVLLLETLIIGAFSLFAGLLIGVLLSQGLAVVTASMFAVQIKQFRMVFSMDACLKSLLYFGIIFLVVMLFNSFSISRRKLIDLLNAERKNEELKIKKLWLSVLLFLVSVGVLAVAY